MLLQVVKMELSSLISEEKLVATWVELKVVDLAVMTHLDDLVGVLEVLDANGEWVKQVGDDLGRLSSSKLLLRVVKSG